MNKDSAFLPSLLPLSVVAAFLAHMAGFLTLPFISTF